MTLGIILSITFYIFCFIGILRPEGLGLRALKSFTVASKHEHIISLPFNSVSFVSNAPKILSYLILYLNTTK
jgi:hypothetical protein